MKHLKLLGSHVKLVFIGLILLIVSIIGINIFVENSTWLVASLGALAIVLTVLLVIFIVKELAYINQLAAATNNDEDLSVDKRHRDKGFIKHLLSLRAKMNEVIAFVNAENSQSFEFQHIDPNGGVGKVLMDLAQQQQQVALEEERRNWKNEGLAKFGEILRMDKQDLNEMCHKILSNLVRYVKANQGGLFVAYEEDGERYMELTASYAYDRKKYVELRVEEGDGLLGEIMLEKDIIYLKDIPSNYVHITSGLGESTPTNLIIVPLMVNDEFYGAIELASFKIFEPYQIEFLKVVAENIASAVATIRINEHTQSLLSQSQEMSQELRSREEEMRQNMEELQATQDEMERKQTELDGVFSALDNSQGLAEFDQEGELLMANEQLQSMFDYSFDELRYKTNLILPEKEDRFWDRLKNGESISARIPTWSKSGNRVWLDANYSPVKDKVGNFKKVLMLATDVTARRQKEEEFESLSLVADNTDNSVIITCNDGLVEYVNKGFERLTGYTLAEMKGRKPGDVLQGPGTDPETVKRISDKLRNNESLFEEILNYHKSEQCYWISLAISPVFDDNGKVDKYISIQADITKTKKIALDYHYKLEAIGRANAIAEFDTTGNILEVNDNFLKIFKYKKEEVMGKHHRMFLLKKECETEAYQEFWRKLANGEIVNKEFKRLDKHGKEVWLRGIYNPILDINGKVIKIVKFATDITRERQLQVETKKQQEEIKSHLETIDKTIASLEFNMDGKISYVNQVYLDVTGYEAHELVGNNYDFLLPVEDLEKPQTQMMWMSLKEGNYFTGEFRQKAKSGKFLWLGGTFNPILGEDGKPEKVMMFTQFTTHYEEKKENLTQTINAFKQSAPYVEFNTNGTFKSANDKFFEMFGYSRMELRQKPIDFLIDSSASKKGLTSRIQKFEQEECIHETLTFNTKDGDKKTFRVTFSPIRNLEDELVKIVMIMMGETSLIKIEQ
ncbi:MAG: PAS domain S-box protein [Bacteroidota bacterium]